MKRLKLITTAAQMNEIYDCSMLLASGLIKEQNRRDKKFILDFDTYFHERRLVGGCNIWMALAMTVENIEEPKKVEDNEIYQQLKNTTLDLLWMQNVRKCFYYFDFH